MRIRFAPALAGLILISAAIAPASAATSDFDFANLTFIGNVNAGFLPSDGVPCTGGDLCSSAVPSVFDGDLNYTIGSITATATGTFNAGVAAVVQDHENNYNKINRIGAGLGVYHIPNDTSDDNITTGEVLTITFDQVVTLSQIDLRSEGHNVTNWIANATFLFNGSNTLLPAGTGSISGLNLVGTVFTFGFGGQTPDQFYLAGMTVAAIPEPGTYAMMLAGLGLMGFIARRRRERETAA